MRRVEPGSVRASRRLNSIIAQRGGTTPVCEYEQALSIAAAGECRGRLERAIRMHGIMVIGPAPFKRWR